MQSIILAGVARSGKTTLAKRIQKATGLTLLSGDALIASFGGIFPQLDITLDGGTQKTSQHIKDFLRAWLEQHQRYQHIPFVLDISHLMPEHAVELKLHELYRMVFFGYPEIDPQEKFNHIRTHKNADYDWSDEKSDQELMELVNHFINRSWIMRESCQRLGLEFVDTSQNLTAQLDRAFSRICADL